MPSIPKLSALRIDALTGIRALAAFVVFLFHWGMFSGTGLFHWGFIGVSLFFCLSGFVLIVNYEQKLASLNRTNYLRFMQARIARIWPIHLVGFFLSLPLLLYLHRALSVKAAVLNLLMLHSFIPGTTDSYNGDSWSISNEFFFYLMFPLLTVAMLRYLATPGRLILAFVSISALLLLFVPLFAWHASQYIPFLNADRVQWILYFFPGSRIVEFMLGMIVGKLWLSRKDHSSSSWSVAIILLLCAGLVLLMNQWSLKGENFTLLFGPLFAMLLFFLAKLRESHFIRRFLSTSWMIKLGEWSFSFYIIHEILLKEVLLLKLHPILSGLLAFVIALVGAGLLYHHVESPLRRLLLKPVIHPKPIKQAVA